MSTDNEQLRGRVLRAGDSETTVEVVNVELPKRQICYIGAMSHQPTPEMMREAGIERIAKEQEVPFEEAEVIYDRMLENIRRALDNS